MKKTVLSAILALLLILGTAACALAEETLWDDQDLTIIVKSIETGNDSLAIKLYLENKTDKEIMFSLESASVNGWDSDPFWAEAIPAGKKANETLTWRHLSEDGITTPPSIIALAMRAYDNDDWFAPDFIEQVFTLYPDGEQSAHTDQYEIRGTDTVLADNNDVTVVVTGYGTSWLGGYAVRLFLRNKTDRTVMFSADDVSVNGFVCDPFWAAEVMPNSQAMKELSWLKSTFEENDIETVEEIEMKLRAYDSDDWSAPNFLEEYFTLHP